MKLLPTAGNGLLSCLAIGEFRGIRLVAYGGTQDNIYITAPPNLRVVQCLSGWDYSVSPSDVPLSHRLSAVAGLSWNSSGQLAACIIGDEGESVVVFSPKRLQKNIACFHQMSSVPYEWVEVFRANLRLGTRCVAWMEEPRSLFFGGDNLSLWSMETVSKEVLRRGDGIELQGKEIWHQQHPTRISFLEASPDGQYIGTHSEHSRFVKIWYRNLGHFPACRLAKSSEQPWGYQCVVLRHQRAVVSAPKWRSSPIITKNGKKKNIIMTVSFDNQLRLWMENKQEERDPMLAFQLRRCSCTIPPQFSVCFVVPLESSGVASWLWPVHEIFPVAPPEVPVIDKREGDDDPDLSLDMDLTPLHSARDDEWIVVLNRNGSLAIWHIAGLSNHCGRLTPSPEPVFRSTCLPKDLASSSLFMEVTSLTRPLSLSDFPTAFEFISYSRSGCLDSISVDFSHSPGSSNTIVEVLGKCYGHHTEVRSLEMHNALPFLVSSSETESCIWRVLSPKLGQIPKIDLISLIEHFNVVSWVPDAELLLAHNSQDQGSSAIHILQIKISALNEPYLTAIGKIEDPSASQNLRYESLMTLPSEDPPNFFNEKPAVIKFIGISKSSESVHVFRLSVHLGSEVDSPSHRLGRSLAIRSHTEANFDVKWEHVKTERFAEGEKITCASTLKHKSGAKQKCSSAAESSNPPDQSGLGYHLATGHEDGTIRFWRHGAADADPEWKKVGQFVAHRSSVTKISFSSFSRFASSAAREQEVPKARITTIKVWELESAPPLFQVEDALTFKNVWEGARSDFRAQNIAEREQQSLLDEENRAKRFDKRDGNVQFDWIDLPNGSSALITSYCNSLLQSVGKPRRPRHFWNFTIFLQQVVGEASQLSGMGSAWRATPYSVKVTDRVTSMRWLRSSSNIAVGVRSGLYFIDMWEMMCMMTACGTAHPLSRQTPDSKFGFDIVRTSEEIVEARRCVDWAAVNSLRNRNTCGVRMSTQDLVQYTRGLPSFHPRILIEYMMAGKFEVVGSVLNCLVQYCRKASEKGKRELLLFDVPFQKVMGAVSKDLKKKKEVTQTAAAPASVTTSSFGRAPKYGFLSRGAPAPQQSQKYSFLSRAAPLPEFNSSSSSSVSSSSSAPSETPFTVEDAKDLSHFLSQMELLCLTHKEQVQVLPVIDTYIHMKEKQDALDECGIRFLVKFKLYNFLQRSPKAAEEAPLKLLTSDFCWAYHSESQQVLLDTCIPDKCDWPTARKLGIGYWLKSRAVLQDYCGRFAKVHYMKNRDPNDCLFWYIILGKKGVLVDLFRKSKQERFAEFFKQDFTEERWQIAASKNAYALMSKRRYELAAAYFALSGEVNDAVAICIKNLKDHQLALIVSRMVGGDGSSLYQDTLKNYLLRIALGELTEEGEEPPPESKSLKKDIWLASIFYWMLSEQKKALYILLPSTFQNEGKNEKGDQPFKPGLDGLDSHLDESSSTPIHFVKFLRTQSIVRQVEVDHKLEAALHRHSAYVFSSSGAIQLAYEQALYLKQKNDLLKEKEVATPASAPAPASNISPFGGGSKFGGAPRVGGFGFGRPAARPSFMSSFNAPPKEDDKEKEKDKEFKKLVRVMVDNQFLENLSLRLLCKQALDDSDVYRLGGYEEPYSLENDEVKKEREEKKEEKKIEEEKNLEEEKNSGEEKKEDASKTQEQKDGKGDKEESGGDDKEEKKKKKTKLAKAAQGPYFTKGLHQAIRFIIKSSSLSPEQIFNPLIKWAKTCCFPSHMFSIKHVAPIATYNHLSSANVFSLFLTVIHEYLKGLFYVIKRSFCANLELTRSQGLALVDSALELWFSFDFYCSVLPTTNTPFLGSMVGVMLLSVFLASWVLRPFTPALSLLDSVLYDCLGTPHRLGEGCSGLYHFLRVFGDLSATIRVIEPMVEVLKNFRNEGYEFKEVPEEEAQKKKRARRGGSAPSWAANDFLHNYFRFCQLRKLTRAMEHVMFSVAMNCCGQGTHTLIEVPIQEEKEPEIQALSDWEFINAKSPSKEQSPSPPPLSPAPQSPKKSEEGEQGASQKSGEEEEEPELTSSTEATPTSFENQNWARVRTWILSTEWQMILDQWEDIERRKVEQAGLIILGTPKNFGFPANFAHQIKADPTEALRTACFGANVSIESAIWESFTSPITKKQQSGRPSSTRGGVYFSFKNVIDELAAELLHLDLFVQNWDRHLDCQVVFDPPTDACTVYQDRSKQFIQSCCADPGSTYLVLATSDSIREFSWRVPPTENYYVNPHGIESEIHQNSMNISSPSLVEEGAPFTAPLPTSVGASGRVSSTTKPYPRGRGNSSRSGNHRKAQLIGIDTSRELIFQNEKPAAVWHLEHHPFLRYYVSGGEKGKVTLWEFGNSRPLARYGTHRECDTRVNRIHFNRSGTKMGACDMDGYLSLWNFSPGAPLMPDTTTTTQKVVAPYLNVMCYTKRTYDFCFLNEGSVVATAGCNSSKGYFQGSHKAMGPLRPTPSASVGIWDFLLPQHRTLVASLPYPQDESGATAIFFSPRHNMLVVGGKKGEICAFDLRMNKLLQKIETHENTVKSLTLHPSERLFVSGSSDGNMKVWDLPSLECRDVWTDSHARHTIVRPATSIFSTPVSTFGVMNVRFTSLDHLYSCGADGRLRKYDVHLFQSD